MVGKRGFETPTPSPPAEDYRLYLALKLCHHSPVDELVDKYNTYCEGNQQTNDDMTYFKGSNSNKWLSDEYW